MVFALRLLFSAHTPSRSESPLNGVFGSGCRLRLTVRCVCCWDGGCTPSVETCPGADCGSGRTFSLTWFRPASSFLTELVLLVLLGFHLPSFPFV